MKILFLNYEYPPLGGGAATATEAIVKEFAKDPQLEVHVVTSALGSTVEHQNIGGQVFLHRLPIGKDPDKLHSQSLRDILVYTWKSYHFLRKFLAEEKNPFDATIAFFTIPCGLVAYLMKRRFALPYAVSLRGADVPGFSEKYDLFYLFLKPLVRFLWRNAVRVIPNSVGIRDLAQKTSPNQAMEIIENGVDTEMFFPAATPHPREAAVFLSTSRLTYRKGVDNLLRAFAYTAHKTTQAVELWLVGDGEEREKLENLTQELEIKEKVRFLGRRSHEDIATVYRESDVFVLPSRNEGMSNAALEALASGLPLVVSHTGGMQELVEDGRNGFFIHPENTPEFGEKMLILAQSPEMRDAFGKESRMRAETRSWSNVARRFLKSLSL